MGALLLFMVTSMLALQNISRLITNEMETL